MKGGVEVEVGAEGGVGKGLVFKVGRGGRVLFCSSF